MREVNIGDWVARLDPDATRRAYQTVDPTLQRGACCSDCDTVIDIIERGAFPKPFLDFVEMAGIDLLKPNVLDVLADHGHLSASYLFVGQLPDGEWDGGSVHSSFDLAPGFTYWLTTRVSPQAPLPFRDLSLVQIEFTWQSDIVSDMYSAYADVPTDAEGDSQSRNSGF